MKRRPAQAVHLKRYSFKSAPSNNGRRRIPRLHFLPLAFQQVVSGIIGKAAHYRDSSDGAVIALSGSFGVLSATVVEGERSTTIKAPLCA
jgi:hypothetical protein